MSQEKLIAQAEIAAKTFPGSTLFVKDVPPTYVPKDFEQVTKDRKEKNFPNGSIVIVTLLPF